MPKENANIIDIKLGIKLTKKQQNPKQLLKLITKQKNGNYTSEHIKKLKNGKFMKEIIEETAIIAQ